MPVRLNHSHGAHGVHDHKDSPHHRNSPSDSNESKRELVRAPTANAHLTDEGVADVHGKKVHVVAVALCGLGIHHKGRFACIWLASWRWFERFIMTSIVINSFFLAASLSSPDFESSLAYFITDKFFTAVFTLEMVVKVVAQGLIKGKSTYLRSPWNILDAVVVVTSLLQMNLTVMRCFKLLRPLRTLSRLKGMRHIVATIASSVTSLQDLVAICFFVLSIFAIIGLNLMGSVSWQRCRSTHSPLSGTAEWPLHEETEDRFCGGAFNCNPGVDGLPVCGNLLEDAPKGTDLSAVLSKDPSAEYGVMGFQNFPSALLTVFQVSTLENWELQMYKYRDGSGTFLAVLFFPLLVVIGNFFIMNLVMAILWEKFNQACNDDNDGKNLMESEEEEQSRQRKARVVMLLNNIGDPIIAQDPSESMLVHPPVSPGGDSTDTLAAGMKVIDHMMRATFLSWKAETNKSKMMLLRRTFNTVEELLHFIAQVECERQLTLELLEMSTNKRIRTSVFQIDVISNVRAQLRRFVRSDACQTFILIVISANAVTIATNSHPPLNEDAEKVLRLLNAVFTVIFAAEVLIKLFAYYPKEFVKDRFNVFDAFIVLVSVVELSIGDSQEGVVFSVLRLCRLLRVFKLARNIMSVRVLLQVLLRSAASLANFIGVLVLFIFIFMLFGMQIFAGTLSPPGVERPRLHFDDLIWSFTTVFVILTANEWNEIMLECGFISGQWKASILYFLLVLIVLNLVLLPLFMAIVASSFAMSHQDLYQECMQKLLILEKQSYKEYKELLAKHVQEKEELERQAHYEMHRFLTEDDLETGFWLYLGPVQEQSRAILQHSWFEKVVLIAIIVSSLLLSLDSPYLDPDSKLKGFLRTSDVLFFVLFLSEAIVKIFAHGAFTKNGGYFRSFWNILDFSVVMVSVLDLLASFAGLGSKSTMFSNARVLRALRALRPLRLISRNRGMRIIVQSLLEAIPGLLSTLIIAFLFFFVFAALGVQFFKGRMAQCTSCMARDMSHCSSFDKEECEAKGGTWETPDVNFNNLGAALFALIRVALGASWDKIMFQCTDAVGIDKAPQENANAVPAILFFVVFIVAGSFIILNLFVGVIVDKFQEIRASSDNGSPFLTDDQMKWVEVQRQMLTRPLKVVRKPPWAAGSGVNSDEDTPGSDQNTSTLRNGEMDGWLIMRRRAFWIIEQRAFEFTVCGLVGLNSMSLCFRHATMSDDFQIILWYMNVAFAVLFSFEATIKLVGLGRLFFTDRWNNFDIVIVVGTNILLVLDLIIPGVGERFGQLALVVRTLRVGRMLRLLRWAGGLQRLFATMLAAIPALLNISALLLLLFYIYACLGHALFGALMRSDGLHDHSNFETFGGSMLSWMVMATGAQWEFIVQACSRSPEGCVDDQSYADLMRDGPRECGSPTSAIVIILSFQFLVVLVVMSLFVAVVLETFMIENSKKENDTICAGIEKLCALWTEYNPNGQRLMEASRAAHLLLKLPPPIGLSDLYEESHNPFEVRDLAMAALGHAEVRIWEKKVHLHDILLFCCKRACVWTTLGEADLSARRFRSLLELSEVEPSHDLCVLFQRQFPEFRGSSGGLRTKAGAEHVHDFDVKHKLAVDIISLRWLLHLQMKHARYTRQHQLTEGVPGDYCKVDKDIHSSGVKDFDCNGGVEIYGGVQVPSKKNKKITLVQDEDGDVQLPHKLCNGSKIHDDSISLKDQAIDSHLKVLERAEYETLEIQELQSAAARLKEIRQKLSSHFNASKYAPNGHVEARNGHTLEAVELQRLEKVHVVDDEIQANEMLKADDMLEAFLCGANEVKTKPETQQVAASTTTAASLHSRDRASERVDEGPPSEEMSRLELALEEARQAVLEEERKRKVLEDEMRAQAALHEAQQKAAEARTQRLTLEEQRKVRAAETALHEVKQQALEVESQRKALDAQMKHQAAAMQEQKRMLDQMAKVRSLTVEMKPSAANHEAELDAMKSEGVWSPQGNIVAVPATARSSRSSPRHSPRHSPRQTTIQTTIFEEQWSGDTGLSPGTSQLMREQHSVDFPDPVMYNSAFSPDSLQTGPTGSNLYDHSGTSALSGMSVVPDTHDALLGPDGAKYEARSVLAGNALLGAGNALLGPEGTADEVRGMLTSKLGPTPSRPNTAPAPRRPSKDFHSSSLSASPASLSKPTQEGLAQQWELTEELITAHAEGHKKKGKAHSSRQSGASSSSIM